MERKYKQIFKQEIEKRLKNESANGGLFINSQKLDELFRVSRFSVIQ